MKTAFSRKENSQHKNNNIHHQGSSPNYPENITIVISDFTQFLDSKKQTIRKYFPLMSFFLLKYDQQQNARNVRDIFFDDAFFL